jgi:predicted GNAT family N-acyltransferase
MLTTSQTNNRQITKINTHYNAGSAGVYGVKTDLKNICDIDIKEAYHIIQVKVNNIVVAQSATYNIYNTNKYTNITLIVVCNANDKISANILKNNNKQIELDTTKFTVSFISQNIV